MKGVSPEKRCSEGSQSDSRKNLAAARGRGQMRERLQRPATALRGGGEGGGLGLCARGPGRQRGTLPPFAYLLLPPPSASLLLLKQQQRMEVISGWGDLGFALGQHCAVGN